MSELESQRKEAGEIVQKWFRFRARRGIGVFYALVSLVSVLGNILSTVFHSDAIMIAGVSLAVVFAWIFSRMAGLAGFSKMTSTLSLLKADASQRANSFLRAAIFLFIVLWPWIAYAYVTEENSPPLQILFALVWLVEFVAYRFISLRQNKNPIVPHRIEDWVVIVTLPMSAIISTIMQGSGLSSFSGFLFLSPIILFCGIKSLYDAPKELVSTIDAE